MALAKIARHFRQHGLRSVLVKVWRELPAYAAGLHLWRIRRCRCCLRLSLFISNSRANEFCCCALCGANERYELLAMEIRERYGPRLKDCSVVEFDPASPLRPLLSKARSYTRTFFSPAVPKGQWASDGSRCEDITQLTLADAAVDLMISSDVLEHVPDLTLAFREIARVLSPGGMHLFTVPFRDRTRMRARISGTAIEHLEPPEYHCDPLDRNGILAFWDIGPDFGSVISRSDLVVQISRGPVGRDKRVVWLAAKKPVSDLPAVDTRQSSRTSPALAVTVVDDNV